MTATDRYFQIRFQYNPRREVLWRCLGRHLFRRMIGPGDCVLDLGSGYGSFINNITCGRKIAVDLWPGLREYAGPEVECLIGPVTEAADRIADGTVDFAFASNLFEHLTREEFVAALAVILKKLKPGGTLNIIQPNFKYAFREYFDDYTHREIYTETSLCAFLEDHGFEIVYCHPRFLPLSVISRIPVHPLLIRLYLLSPFKPKGRQMFIRARKPSAGTTARDVSSS